MIDADGVSRPAHHRFRLHALLGLGHGHHQKANRDRCLLAAK